MLPLHHGSRFFHFNRRYRAFCSAGAIGVSTNRRGCFQRIRHVPKQPLNFAKILTRGGRGLLGFAPRDRSPPWGHTPGGAAGGRRYTPGRAGRLPGAAGTSRAGSAAPGGGYTPGRRRGPGQRVHPGQAGSPGGDPATAPGSAPSGLCVDGGHGRPTVALAAGAADPGSPGTGRAAPGGAGLSGGGGVLRRHRPGPAGSGLYTAGGRKATHLAPDICGAIARAAGFSPGGAGFFPGGVRLFGAADRRKAAFLPI